MRNYFKETDQVVRRELRRIVRQPMYWVLMVVLPVVSFAFFAVIFERGVARNIPIAVLDEDHTTLSRKVTQMIDDTPTAMVSYEVQSMEEAQRLMREGRISAIVHIPAFFEKNILSNSQTHIECSVSGTNITVNGLLSKDLQTAVTTFHAGVQQDLPLYVLYRHLHRSGASRRTGRRFAVGHGVYRTLHRTADALPAAPAQDLFR